MLTETHTLADRSLIMQQALGIRLNAVIISLVTIQYIFGEDYTQLVDALFTIGEALDPRLFGTLASADKKLLCLTR
jgi:hypothetical protein